MVRHVIRRGAPSNDGASPVLPTIWDFMTTATGDQIKVLVELQKFDSEIYRLKQELSQQPSQKKRSEEELEKKKTKLKYLDDAQKSLQRKQKDKENDLLSREEKIKKLQAQLYQLKSNKEYQTMELEIKRLKADKSLLEEEILKLLDEVDAARAKLIKEKELLEKEEKAFKAAAETLNKRASEIQVSTAEREEKRKAYAPNVEAKLIAQYEKILKNREGMALVPVRNNSCGGCHIELPPQVVNEIQLQDKWIICESCARILYWQP